MKQRGLFSMDKPIDPKKFDLPRQTVIHQRGRDNFSLVMNRKSRLIMADGKKILTKVEKIRKIRPKARVSIETTAPVCGKTKVFLAAHNITILVNG